MRLVFVFAFFISTVAVVAQSASAPAPKAVPFVAGADVSFLREMEADGTVFTDGGAPRPGLEILRNHGFNWVRLRIMNEPTPLPNTLAYTLAEAKAARALGFHILLDFHCSDNWADPAHEYAPQAWAKLSHPQLVDAVFNFSRDTVAALQAQGTMPEMIQIGNEITSGMLWPDGKLPDHWDQLAELLTAGVRGAEAGRGNSPRPAIMIHIDRGGNQEVTKWFFDNLIAHRVPFDVIGQSYYPWWQGSLSDLRGNLTFMAQRYKKPIFVVETAWDWRTGEDFKQRKKEFAETPDGQAAFLKAVIEAVKQTPDGLGRGVFWWEPMAKGAIAKRGLFDDRHEALPAITAFQP